MCARRGRRRQGNKAKNRGKTGADLRTSSASSTDALDLAATFTSFGGGDNEALGAVAEHSFLNAGEAISAPSRDLFLGVSLRAGEGVACREAAAAFLSGLAPFPRNLAAAAAAAADDDDDDGDLVTLMSSEPRARLLVGVAALMLPACSVDA